MPFGQIVIGPPGTGKTTYCFAMQQFMEQLKRKTIIVNLDPANDVLPYECAIDLKSLITLDDVMSVHNLGPNGGMVFCMDYLNANANWLIDQLAKYKDHYVIFDLPGQSELFTLSSSTTGICKTLEEKGYRLCCVNLIDCHYMTSPGKYVAGLLQCLQAMLHLALPHVNIMSKFDLLKNYGQLEMPLEFYTQGTDLEMLIELLNNDPDTSNLHDLNASLVDLIQDYSLVSFIPLEIHSKELMLQCLGRIDKANGYIFSPTDGSVDLSAFSLTLDVQDYDMRDIEDQFCQSIQVHGQNETESKKKSSKESSCETIAE